VKNSGWRRPLRSGVTGETPNLKVCAAARTKFFSHLRASETDASESTIGIYESAVWPVLSRVPGLAASTQLGTQGLRHGLTCPPQAGREASIAATAAAFSDAGLRQQVLAGSGQEFGLPPGQDCVRL
jgi:hypothetical protein